MGGSAPKPAPAPDPAKTAAAQGEANVETAIANALLNNINTFGPGGDVQFTQTGTQRVGDQDVPIFEQRTNLDPLGQQTFNTQQQIALQLAQAAQNQAGFLPQDQFSVEGLPFSPTDRDFSAERDEVEGAVFGRALNLLNPQFEDQERSLQQSIADRGLPITGEDATRQLDRFDQSRGRALEDAALASVLAGSQEQNRLFNLQQAARGQAINEALLERTQPINELAAALQGAPAIGQPPIPASAGVGIAPTDVLGATALQQQVINQNNQLAAQNAQSRNSGLFNLAGGLGQAAILGGLFSDKRLKSNIKFITKINGFKWYSYIMDGIKRVGVLAQELPAHLVGQRDGYLTVDYRGVING